MVDSRNVAAFGRGFLGGFGAASQAGKARFDRQRQEVLDTERRAQRDFENRLREDAAGRAVEASTRAQAGEARAAKSFEAGQQETTRRILREKGGAATGQLSALSKLYEQREGILGTVSQADVKSTEAFQGRRSEIAPIQADIDQREAAILELVNKDKDFARIFGARPGRDFRNFVRLPDGSFTFGVVNDQVNQARGTPGQAGLMTADGREVSPENPPVSFTPESIAIAAGLPPAKESTERQPRLVATVDPDDPSKTIYREIEEDVPFLTERPSKARVGGAGLSVTQRQNYRDARGKVDAARRPPTQLEQIQPGTRPTIEPGSTDERLILADLEPNNETLVYEVNQSGSGPQLLPVPVKKGTEMESYRQLVNFNNYETWDHFRKTWQEDSRLSKLEEHEMFKVYLAGVHAGRLPRTKSELDQIEAAKKPVKTPVATPTVKAPTPKKKEKQKTVKAGVGLGFGAGIDLSAEFREFTDPEFVEKRRKKEELTRKKKREETFKAIKEHARETTTLEKTRKKVKKLLGESFEF